jgi:RNA-directed DNA polymerase
MAKPNGTESGVDAALVHRQFTLLPGEICATGGESTNRIRPGVAQPGKPRAERHGELPAVSEERGSNCL